MRFFGASGVILALGVSAAAGHSYHAFEHGYQPVVSYGGLPTHEDFIHDGHIVIPYDAHSDAPEFHEDLHLNQGLVTYLEPHGDYHGVEHLDDHSRYELPEFDHPEQHKHHEHYVLHDNTEDHIQFGLKEDPAYHSNHDHHDHHEHHANYVLHDNEEHHKKDHKKEHGHHVDQEEHKQHAEHSQGHDDDDHKSVPKYTFKYGVNDPKTGDVKEQWESKTGDKVKGGYSLKESDGTTRVVNYSADNTKGFEATVHKIGHPKETHSDHGHQEH